MWDTVDGCSRVHLETSAKHTGIMNPKSARTSERSIVHCASVARILVHPSYFWTSSMDDPYTGIAILVRL